MIQNDKILKPIECAGTIFLKYKTPTSGIFQRVLLSKIYNFVVHLPRKYSKNPKISDLYDIMKTI